VRILVATNMYPSEARPANGTFVADQVESLRQAGEDVELLFVDRKGGGRKVYRKLADTARRSVENSMPDLVHVMYGGVMAEVITRAVQSVPVLVSFCGSDLLGTPDNGLAGSLSGRYGVIASRRAAMRAAGVVVKSRNLLDGLPKGVDGTRTWIVPNGVDFALFQPRDRAACRDALGWESAREHVLFPASPARGEKRFPLAEASVALLARARANVELHVLEDVPHDEVPVWLNAASVVLLTSSHEGSPNAVKEALACNVPIVSVDVGDVRERIEGIDGCFIAEQSPEDIAAKLGAVLDRNDRIAGRDRVAELSLEGVARTLQGIYRSVARG
jgi:Glycosyl transferases group 1